MAIECLYVLTKISSILILTAGTDRLNEIYEQSSSHPPSGESSARQTPQPTPQSHNKEVQAAFAKQVMQAINTDNESVHIDDQSNHQEPAEDHIEQLTYPPPLQQQAVQTSNARLDNIVQSSNLKVSDLYKTILLYLIKLLDTIT